MRAFGKSLIIAFGLVLAQPALAQDDFEMEDDFTFEGEEEPADDSERLDDADDLDSVDDAGDEDLEDFFDDDEEGGDDLLGDDANPTAADSTDSPAVYRQTIDSVKDAQPDEEIQVWEQYLQTHPTTAFRDRISKRIAELEQLMYDGGIIDSSGPIDAMDQEIHFAHAMTLENIDPRTRFQIGAEFGLPSYINLFVDYEHAFARNFSAHAGVRRRYTGYSVEPGFHWALVKSTRTNTIVTLIGDLHVNTIPSWFGVRPQLALGKRFGENLDLQIQGGPDFELRSFDADGGPPIRIVGGANASYHASDTVRIFFETSWNMKQLTREGGSFRYNIVSFGMKFFPKKDKRTDQVSDDVEVNMGANVPYSYNYWTYHLGSAMVQTNLYL